MGLFDIFSKRQKEQGGEFPDVFKYNDIPQGLRVQIIHIWKDAFGDLNTYGRSAPEIYGTIYQALCREYGVFSLTERPLSNYLEGLADFLLSTTEYEKALDVIELSFRSIDRVCRDSAYHYQYGSRTLPDDAIEELNHRFYEHGVGYQYESGQLIRVDSHILHSEVIKPALFFLQGPEFKGANDEFLKAHENYRNGKYKECLNESLKALESTLKVLCKRKGWAFKETDTANTLINICFQNELIPQFLQSEFSAIRSILESGTPTTRNKMSGHGQGEVVIEVPPYIANYILHITASSILLLIDAATSGQ